MAWLTESFINKFVPAEYDVFVETGTFLGRTIDNLKDKFKALHSIELSEKYYNLSTERFAKNNHITIHKGDSANILRTIVNDRIGAKLVFWLDAHWSAADTAKGSIECPLLSELEVLNNLKYPPIIFIDDVRLFCKKPPKPYAPEEWCSISKIVNALLLINKDYIITIKEDIMISWMQ